ncbi:G protein-coupled receptor GPR1 [Sphaceloma murrayae]|uniref:G protein-coupled receptor GPR1 n=1 Tax=Sphaceloma murrayae TaxID=2082308 RepID=A0A2K1QLG3_9PEZI|nr:G protein-coupled receptor GPR1 [Sphaceloma murrayae]
MVFAEVQTLVERGLSSGPTDGLIYSAKNAEHIRIIATSLASLSMIADLMTMYWFFRMKRKWRHSLIITLAMADLLKDMNYISFSAVAFIEKHIVSESQYCQASGFFHQYLVEVTDFVILTMVVHMSVQILNPNGSGESEGGLARWKGWIMTCILGLPFIMACIAFSNHNGGYQLVGAFCWLPVRPFWYRLTLAWIPRYIIAVTIVVLSIIIRYKIKRYQMKLEQLQRSVPDAGGIEEVIEELDEMSSDDGDVIQEKPEEHQLVDEKRQSTVQPSDIPPVPTIPAGHQQFDSDNLRKFKRMSYKRRQLPPINTGDMTSPRGDSIPVSVAPSSAVFVSPTRSEFPSGPEFANRGSMFFDPKRNSILEDVATPDTISKSKPDRRKSVADFNPRRSQSVIEFPTLKRRSSLVEVAPRAGSVSRNSVNQPFPPAERMSSIQSTGRRSSIWDEIDASLEKKATNRISIFTITASEAGDVSLAGAGAGTETVTYESDKVALNARHSMVGHPNPLGQNRLSRAGSRQSIGPNSNGRGSMIYSMARRTLSVVSLGRADGTDDTAAVDNSPQAILNRRHRYIQRQLRYLISYPILYLLLWACPFVFHVLQYEDRFALHPPFAAAVLNIVSMTVFGLVNSVVFCLREKPWTAIEEGDGTLVGSWRCDPVVGAVREWWWRVRGRGEEEELDFEG